MTVKKKLAGSQPYNEKEVLQRIATGDEAAFSFLFYQFAPRLHSYLTGITGSEASAEELVQNTFIRVWVYRDQLIHVHHPAAWIHRVAANEAFNFLKRKSKEQSVLLEVSRSNEPYAGDDIAYNELKKTIAEAIAALPEKRRRIWRLVREEGLRPAVVAEQLGISISTVKNTLAEGQKNIRDFLEDRGFWMLAILFMRW